MLGGGILYVDSLNQHIYAMAKQKVSKRSLSIRIGLSAAVLAAAALVLALHWDTVKDSVHVARGASTAWLGLSLVLMAATFVVASGPYSVLALHHLRFRQTVLVQTATAFVNRLLPSGLGGLGLNGVYLYKRGHTTAEATVVVSVNNLLGIVAHGLLVVCVIVFDRPVLHRFRTGKLDLDWPVAAGVVALLCLLLLIPPVRRKLTSFARNVLKSIRKMSVMQLLMALPLAALLTVTYTSILYSVTRSLGLDLSLLQVLIVFSIGMFASTATPVPGGLVGAEAGLFAGFVAYGVSEPTAGAVVLLYRLVSYWIPLLPGVGALVLARRKRLV
jgi:uncharacterized membrane protein YbhN (UPF0104 family)